MQIKPADRPRGKPGPKPRVKPVKPLLHTGRKGPRPLLWKMGPDPVIHAQYVAWMRARAQAHFRREPWDLTFEQYQSLWGDQWANRGRTRDTLCLSRYDYDLGWSMDNCRLVTRQEHNQHQADWRMGRR